MSKYAMVTTCHPPSVVTHSVVCHFTGATHRNLVVARANRLQIFQMVENGLQGVVDVPVHGRIASLAVLPPRSEAKLQTAKSAGAQRLLVVTDRFQFSQLEWQANDLLPRPVMEEMAGPTESSVSSVMLRADYATVPRKNAYACGNLRTVACGNVAHRVGRVTEQSARALVDPHGRCVAFHLYDGLVQVVKLNARTKVLLNRAYDVRMKERDIRHICFVHTPYCTVDAVVQSHNPGDKRSVMQNEQYCTPSQPHLCVLYSEINCGRFVVMYRLDRDQMTLKAVTFPYKVDSTASHLISLPAEAGGGVLVVGENAIVHFGAEIPRTRGDGLLRGVSGHSTSTNSVMCVRLPSVQVESWTRIDANRYLFGDLSGRVYGMMVHVDAHAQVGGEEVCGHCKQPSSYTMEQRSPRFVFSSVSESKHRKPSAVGNSRGNRDSASPSSALPGCMSVTVTPLGFTSVAATLSYLDNGFFFVGSVTGDSQVVQLVQCTNDNEQKTIIDGVDTTTNLTSANAGASTTSSDKPGQDAGSQDLRDVMGTTRVVHTFPSLGSIVDMAVIKRTRDWVSDGESSPTTTSTTPDDSDTKLPIGGSTDPANTPHTTETHTSVSGSAVYRPSEVVTCSGAYGDGSLRVLKDGVSIHLNGQLSCDVGVEQAWGVAAVAPPGKTTPGRMCTTSRFLVMSFPFESRVMRVSTASSTGADSVARLHPTTLWGFDTDNATLYVSQCLGNEGLGNEGGKPSQQQLYFVQVTGTEVRTVPVEGKTSGQPTISADEVVPQRSSHQARIVSADGVHLCDAEGRARVLLCLVVEFDGDLERSEVQSQVSFAGEWVMVLGEVTLDGWTVWACEELGSAEPTCLRLQIAHGDTSQSTTLLASVGLWSGHVDTYALPVTALDDPSASARLRKLSTLTLPVTQSGFTEQPADDAERETPHSVAVVRLQESKVAVHTQSQSDDLSARVMQVLVGSGDGRVLFRTAPFTLPLSESRPSSGVTPSPSPSHRTGDCAGWSEVAVGTTPVRLECLAGPSGMVLSAQQALMQDVSMNDVTTHETARDALGVLPCETVQCARVFAACNAPAVLCRTGTSKESIMCAYVHLNGCTSVTRLPTPQRPNGLCFVHSNQLSFGQLDPRRRLYIEKVPLHAHPRKVLHWPSKRVVLCAVMQPAGIPSFEWHLDQQIRRRNARMKVGGNDEAGEMTVLTDLMERYNHINKEERNYIRVFSDRNYEYLGCVKLDLYEDIGAMLLVTVPAVFKDAAHSHEQILLVGTGYSDPTDSEPSTGRILAFTMQGESLLQISECIVEGGVYSLDVIPPKTGTHGGPFIVCGINNKVRVLEWYSPARQPDTPAPETKSLPAPQKHISNIASTAVQAQMAPGVSARLRKVCSFRGNIIAWKVRVVADEYIYVGDVMQSVCLLRFDRQYRLLQMLSNHAQLHWIMDLMPLNPALCLCADQVRNLFVVTRPLPYPRPGAKVLLPGGDKNAPLQASPSSASAPSGTQAMDTSGGPESKSTDSQDPHVQGRSVRAVQERAAQLIARDNGNVLDELAASPYADSYLFTDNVDDQFNMRMVSRYHCGYVVNCFLPRTTLFQSKLVPHLSSKPRQLSSSSGQTKATVRGAKTHTPTVTERLELEKLQVRCVFGTVSGAIGCVTSLTKAQYEFLHALEQAMEQTVLPVGLLAHREFTQFHNERDVTPSEGFIDGDFIESLLHIFQMEKITQTATERLLLPGDHAPMQKFGLSRIIATKMCIDVHELVDAVETIARCH